MPTPFRHTKIVATIGPASSSPEVMRQLVRAGMNVARLNFSHGAYEDHAAIIKSLRRISDEEDQPLTLLADLQGPKVRVGNLPAEGIALVAGAVVELWPEAQLPATVPAGTIAIPIDYPLAAEDARPGMRVLLADGLFELAVESIAGPALRCRVIAGGTLTRRKGVNFPELDLRLPALTEKDLRDLDFAISQKVNWISLSFVRSPADVRGLKEQMAARGVRLPVVAKIEKPQALERLDAILAESDGIMVARGDLGVEMRPEQVPLAQKRIITACNRLGIPVITATQMLESMIHDPRPTRAEASDVANAILDGTDAVMLSGESAVGAHPVKAVEMMDRIAREVETHVPFRPSPPLTQTINHIFGESVEAIGQHAGLAAVVVATRTGDNARLAAAQRPLAPVVALTTEIAVQHTLNLVWGIRPLLVEQLPADPRALIVIAERVLLWRGCAHPGDRILVMGSLTRGEGDAEQADFLALHQIR